MLLLCAQLHIYRELCLPLSVLLGSECMRERNRSDEVTDADGKQTVLRFRPEDQYSTMNCEIDDMENRVEQEEKTRLINQVLELQHTLEDLSARVDAVKEENLKLKSENQVLGQYIENLMSASSVFQTTDTKSKRK
ncbi:short coiled-coil protein A isoform X2 [Onychostoma macrolepis]|uniref:short coiled-coil protein A isoform X2 n=2 Tax=Onychostoma macrolepis TaxID=369639 RepID=UPI00272A6D23|nr:short coiled-coil protein A isoform X2 [Onychostoma macrolepis]